MNKGLATQQLKSRLKNDQNNHLSIQLEQFIKNAPQVINQRDSSVKVPYESQFSDTVTFAYVRGYN